MEHSNYTDWDTSSFGDVNYRTLIRQTVVATSVGMLLFIGNMFHWIPAPETPVGYWINWLCAIVTLWVLVYSGGHFFRGTWLALKAKCYNQDLLVSIAIGANWLYAVVALPQHLYFETPVIIIAIVNLGIILEKYFYKNCNIYPNGNTNGIWSRVNKIATMLVPIVIGIALATAIIWYFIDKQPVMLFMLISFMSVLLVASPNALRLAVPTSVINGIYKAAQLGILIHNPNVILTACSINTVIFNKTGTLTLGKPKVTIIAAPGIDPNQVLSIAASLDAKSTHPYALAVLTAAKEQQLNIAAVSDFQNFAGLGVKGLIAGQPACIGNKGFMEAQLVKIDALQNNANNCAKTGVTAVYVASNKQLIGLITLADPIIPEAKILVQKIHDMQIRVIMMTGDQQLAAEAIARQIGITEVIADVMPQEKAHKISTLQLEDAIVAMIGNDINDDAALAQADVGFALGAAINSTVKNADIILSHSSLDNIMETIYISKATVNNMKQNLFGAFIYNIIGIPIAAGVLYPFTDLFLSPTLIAAAMVLSSIIVIANANRLRFLQRSLPA